MSVALPALARGNVAAVEAAVRAYASTAWHEEAGYINMARSVRGCSFSCN